MAKTTPDKEQFDLVCQQLSKILPALFRLHSQLLKLADHETKEINCTLNELSQRLHCNRYVLFCLLGSLAEIKFIKFPRSCDFHQKVKIKILVY